MSSQIIVQKNPHIYQLSRVQSKSVIVSMTAIMLLGAYRAYHVSPSGNGKWFMLALLLGYYAVQAFASTHPIMFDTQAKTVTDARGNIHAFSDFSGSGVIKTSVSFMMPSTYQPFLELSSGKRIVLGFSMRSKQVDDLIQEVNQIVFSTGER